MAETLVPSRHLAGRGAIEELRSPEGTLDRSALLSLLPYGEEFLFVDAVSRLEPEVVEASFLIPPEMPYVRAHFQDLPVMPGALVAEGWAQSGTLLVRYNLENGADKVVLGMQIERARFDAPTWPGETLHYLVRLRALDSRAARLEGEVRTAERKVARLKIVVGLMDREAFLALTPGACGPAGE